MYGLRELIVNQILSIKERTAAVLSGRIDSLFTTICLHLPVSGGYTYPGPVRIDRNLHCMDEYSRHDLFDPHLCEAFRTDPLQTMNCLSAKNPRQILLLIGRTTGAMNGYACPGSIRSIFRTSEADRDNS